MSVAIKLGMCEGGNMMGRRHLVIVAAALLLLVIPASALAADGDRDTDTRMVDAKVVEVTEHRISVIARTGVEHVIAINDTDTKVSVKGKTVSLKDLREGDVVTVELDALNPLKFAKQISVAERPATELATSVP